MQTQNKHDRNNTKMISTYYRTVKAMARTVKLILYFFAYQLAFSSVFLIGYMICHHTMEIPTYNSPGFLNLSLIAQVLSTLAVGIHLAWAKYAPLDKKTLSPISTKLSVTCVIFIIGMGLWTNYLNEILGLPNTMEELFARMMDNPFGIIAVVVMAPIVEEMLFRGAIEGHLLRKWKNPAWAIIVSSLIFGLVHYNPAQVPFAFVLGIALGWVYYRTGSLFPGMLMHFINNGSSVVLYHLMDNKEATMNELFGPTGAACYALTGIIITTVCVWIISRKLVPQPAVWKKEENISTDL